MRHLALRADGGWRCRTIGLSLAFAAAVELSKRTKKFGNVKQTLEIMMPTRLLAMFAALAALSLSGCAYKCFDEDAAEYSAIPEHARHRPQPGAEGPLHPVPYAGYSDISNPTATTTQPTGGGTTEPAALPDSPATRPTSDTVQP